MRFKIGDIVILLPYFRDEITFDDLGKITGINVMHKYMCKEYDYSLSMLNGDKSGMPNGEWYVYEKNLKPFISTLKKFLKEKNK